MVSEVWFGVVSICVYYRGVGGYVYRIYVVYYCVRSVDVFIL